MPALVIITRLIFGTLSVFKSHIHIITVSTSLNSVCDDAGLDKLFLFKEAIAFFYWKNFEKAMYAEFESLIENDIWEY